MRSAEMVPTHRQFMMMGEIEESPDSNTSELTRAVFGEDAMIPSGVAVLKALIGHGWVRSFGRNRSRRYRVTNAGERAMERALEIYKPYLV